VVAGASLVGSWSRIRQPIDFPHRLHVEQVGMGCLDCHRYAVTQARATIPNVGACADCHEEAQGESAGEAIVVRHVAAGEPIPWQKVYTVPSHVYFSHRRHAGIAGIACERCHGPVGERLLPVTEAAVSLQMNDCLNCHEESGVSNDCILCHR
jgi:hypothetical protein